MLVRRACPQVQEVLPRLRVEAGSLLGLVVLALLGWTIGGCGASGQGVAPDHPETAHSEAVIWTNPQDPALVSLANSSGEFVQFQGTRDETGLPVSVSRAFVTNLDETGQVDFDARGRPSRIVGSSGTLLMRWDVPDGLALTAEVGSSRETVVVQPSIQSGSKSSERSTLATSLLSPAAPFPGATRVTLTDANGWPLASRAVAVWGRLGYRDGGGPPTMRRQFGALPAGDGSWWIDTPLRIADASDRPADLDCAAISDLLEALSPGDPEALQTLLTACALTGTLAPACGELVVLYSIAMKLALEYSLPSHLCSAVEEFIDWARAPAPDRIELNAWSGLLETRATKIYDLAEFPPDTFHLWIDATPPQAPGSIHDYMDGSWILVRTEWGPVPNGTGPVCALPNAQPDCLIYTSGDFAYHAGYYSGEALGYHNKLGPSHVSVGLVALGDHPTQWTRYRVLPNGILEHTGASGYSRLQGVWMEDDAMHYGEDLTFRKQATE